MKSFSRATPSFATFSAISAALRLESVAKEDFGIVAGGLPLSSEIPPERPSVSSENAAFSRHFRGFFCVPRAASSRIGRGRRRGVPQLNLTQFRRESAQIRRAPSGNLARLRQIDPLLRRVV